MGMMMGRGAPPPAPGGQRWLGQPGETQAIGGMGGPNPGIPSQQASPIGGMGGVNPGMPQVNAADAYAPGLMSPAPPQMPGGMGGSNAGLMNLKAQGGQGMPDRGVGPHSRMLLARMLMGR